MAKVRKALIPVAGLGTRFLPVTKTIPKEMLPIVDRPILLYNIEECIRAGIEDIVLIAGRNKTAIEDFFDVSYELEDQLLKTGKEAVLEELTSIRDRVNIISLRQKQALGLGHAVLCGRPVIGNEAFAVLLGDEIMISDSDTPTATQELTSLYSQTNLSSVAVMEVPRSDVSKYGIVEASQNTDGTYTISRVVEKPHPDNAPSCLALPGRYVFSSDIFDHLQNTKPGRGGEIQLTDGMTDLAENQGLLACHFQARRFDAGDKLGYLQANIELALQREDLRPALSNYLKNLVNQL